MDEFMEDLIEKQPGETRAEKVANLKKEASTKNRLSSPEANAIERLDAEGNAPKKSSAKPAAKKVEVTDEILERRAEREKKLGDAALQQRLKDSPARMGGGGGRGGSLGATGPKNLGGKVPEMKKGGKVKLSSASRRGDGIAQRGKTKGRYL